MPGSFGMGIAIGKGEQTIAHPQNQRGKTSSERN